MISFLVEFLTRNRPLRGFATHGEANTPSEASAEGTGNGERGTGASLERLLRATARHHDMICVPVSDPAEGELPDVGLVELEDSETGELMLVDTSSAKVRKAFAAKAESDREELTKFFRKTGIDTLDIATDRPYIDGVRAPNCQAVKILRALDIATDKPYIDGVRALFKRRARKR